MFFLCIVVKHAEILEMFRSNQYVPTESPRCKSSHPLFASFVGTRGGRSSLLTPGPACMRTTLWRGALSPCQSTGTVVSPHPCGNLSPGKPAVLAVGESHQLQSCCPGSCMGTICSYVHFSAPGPCVYAQAWHKEEQGENGGRAGVLGLS